MVRVINHLGKQFRHTVIALDNNFDAAAGIAGDLDIALSPVRGVKRGILRSLAGSTLTLHRLRPDLLLTYNWGAIEWAAASQFSPVARHVHLEAGFGKGEADSQIPRRVLFRRWALPIARWSWSPPAVSRIWHIGFGDCPPRVLPMSRTVWMPRVLPRRFVMA
jgi:hypothetical protein